MKKLCFTILVFIIGFTCKSQTKDSIYSNQINTLSARLRGMESKMDTLNVHFAKLSKEQESIIKQINTTRIGLFEWLLIFSPFVIFGFLLLIIRNNLNKISLSDFMNENEPTRQIIQNPNYVTTLNIISNNPTLVGLTNPPTIEVSNGIYLKSSSRYLAFITSCLTWTITTVLTSFFIYQYINTKEAPDFSKFASVLLSLGIGIVPYAFNKISNAIK